MSLVHETQLIEDAIFDNDIYMIIFYTSNRNTVLIKKENDLYEISVEIDDGDYQFYSETYKTSDELIHKVIKLVRKCNIFYIKVYYNIGDEKVIYNKK
jgi:hypothetical protein